MSSLSRPRKSREKNIPRSLETVISHKTVRETNQSQNRETDFSSHLIPSCWWQLGSNEEATSVNQGR